MLSAEELKAAKSQYEYRTEKREPVTKMLSYIDDQKAYGNLDAHLADNLTEMLLSL